VLGPSSSIADQKDQKEILRHTATPFSGDDLAVGCGSGLLFLSALEINPESEVGSARESLAQDPED
jgi:hypothetical protein